MSTEKLTKKQKGDLVKKKRKELIKLAFLRPAMRLALRKKGVKTSIKWSTEKLANKFVEVVLNKPVKHFEE